MKDIGSHADISRASEKAVASAAAFLQLIEQDIDMPSIDVLDEGELDIFWRRDASGSVLLTFFPSGKAAYCCVLNGKTISKGSFFICDASDSSTKELLRHITDLFGVDEFNSES